MIAGPAWGLRKVRAPKSGLLGNAQAGRPDGECHRKQTADGQHALGLHERTQRCQGTGKGETVV
jgi:hypothetical protein